MFGVQVHSQWTDNIVASATFTVRLSTGTTVIGSGASCRRVDGFSEPGQVYDTVYHLPPYPSPKNYPHINPNPNSNSNSILTVT